MTKRSFNLRNVVNIGITCLALTMMFSGCKNDNPDEPNGEPPVIGFSYHDNEVEFCTLVGDEDGNLTDANWQQWGLE